MFVADAEKTRFDFYFAVDLAEALSEVELHPDPLHWLANRWHLDESPSNNGIKLTRTGLAGSEVDSSDEAQPVLLEV